MRTFFGTLLYPFFLPGGALLGAVFLLLHQPNLLASLLPAQGFILWIVIAAGLFLGWRFNRSRLFLAILALALAERLLALAPGSEGRSLLLSLVGVLLPLNLAVFSCLSERGLLTVRGLSRLVLLAAQVGGGIWLYQYRFAETLALLETPLLNFPVFTSVPLGQPVLAACGLSLAVMLFRFVRRPGVLEAGFFWALAAIALALVGPRAHWPLLFASAGLILVLGLLETFHFMAFRDELTGLPARRAMNEALLKLGSRYTLAMVDIDFFKKFNDRHGHDVGDQVLRMVAARLSAVRGGGRAFRYGGEEFALLFPGCSVEEALPALEQLRENIELSEFSLRGRFRPRKKPARPSAKKSAGKLRVTVSIGVAERGGTLKEPGQVLKAADQALYRAKKRGRNQVCR